MSDKIITVEISGRNNRFDINGTSAIPRFSEDGDFDLRQHLRGQQRIISIIRQLTLVARCRVPVHDYRKANHIADEILRRIYWTRS